MEKITAIVVFPGTQIGDWVFRLSITNSKNIMIFAFNAKEPKDLIIRFFVDETQAHTFVLECVKGMHSP